MLACWRPVFRQVALIAVWAFASMTVWVASDTHAGVSTDLTVTVSLEANPDPDETDGLRYEAILRDFADFVYDATEGAHRIGTIRVYRSASRHDTADIVWQREGHPKASLNGYRASGSDPGQMYMVDVFTGAGVDGSDVPLVDADDIDDHPDAELETAGALLAHEWAHYAYGLLDEHVIAAGDIAVVNSLMNSPWTAAQTVSWRNFSVTLDGMAPFDAFENTQATAHHRAYSKSAWDLIGQMPAPGAELLSPIPGRIEREDYIELRGLPTGSVPGTQAGVAPPTIEWVAPCSTYAIAIDRSGSMGSNERMSRAKLAADFIVRAMRPDTTELGLIAFGSGAESFPPLPPLNRVVSDEPLGASTLRQMILDDIASFTSRQEATSFAAGLNAAFSTFDDICPNGDTPPDSQGLFFISDGTTSEDLTAVDAAVDQFANAGIPIYVIDVSQFIEGETTNPMTRLAARTGGVLLGPQVLVPFAEARQAFNQADARNRSNHLLARAQDVPVPDGGSSNLFQFTVDETLDRFNLCASASGPVENLLLNNPSGAPSARLAFRQTDLSEPDDDCSFFWALDAPPVGVWTVTAAAQMTSGVTADFEARGDSVDSSIALRAWISNPTTPVVYPEPIHVTATLARDRPVVGARVQATLDGGAPTQLRDDGVPPDAFPDDGIYVGSFVYDVDCDPMTSTCNQIELHADEVGPGAAFSSDGIVLAPGVAGNIVSAEAPVPLGSAFDRILDLDGPATTGCCTEAGMVPLDNSAVSGRIGVAGEVDTFTIDASGTSGPGEIRVSGALLGMQPRLRVLDSGGDVLGDETAAGGAAGITVSLDDFNMELLTAEVTNASGSTGTYQISAGSPLNLAFGSGGASGSPCEVASRNKADALTALEGGLSGVSVAQTLIRESRILELTMEDGIDALSDASGRQKKAQKQLRKAARRDKKALKRLRRAERKGQDKELKGARRKIRNAARKLSKACRRLADGGTSLVP